MSGHDLPLFNWQPECRLMAFPLHRQTGKVRDVARKLLTKTTDRHADSYRGQVTDALDRKLQRIGLSEDQINEQIGAFWRAVEVEASRITYRKHGPGGAA